MKEIMHPFVFVCIKILEKDNYVCAFGFDSNTFLILNAEWYKQPVNVVYYLLSNKYVTIYLT